MKNYPVVLCVPSPDGVHLSFHCPHCRTLHSHGAAGGPGHRLSHCHTEAGMAAYPYGYILEIDPRAAHQQMTRGDAVSVYRRITHARGTSISGRRVTARH